MIVNDIGVSVHWEIHFALPHLIRQVAEMEPKIFSFSQFLNEEMRTEQDKDQITGGTILRETHNGWTIIELPGGHYRVAGKDYSDLQWAMDAIEIAERRIEPREWR